MATATATVLPPPVPAAAAVLTADRLQRRAALAGAVVVAAAALERLRLLIQAEAAAGRLSGLSADEVAADVAAVVDVALGGPVPPTSPPLTGIAWVSDPGVAELARPAIDAAVVAGFQADLATVEAEAEAARREADARADAAPDEADLRRLAAWLPAIGQRRSKPKG
jgi:hypothetical protein